MKKILIVEDNELQSSLLKEIMEMEGFEAVIAEDGIYALEALEKERFDLIVSDVNMPRMDGYELAKKVKSKNETTPFILYSAKHPPEIEYLELAKQYGIDKYVEKAGVQGILDEVMYFLKTKH